MVDTCDFETGLCGMKEGSGSNGSWTLSTGSFEKTGGPPGDFTYKTDKGHFLLFNQSNSEKGDVAIQETLSVDVGNDPIKGGQVCLRFYYALYGSDAGSLEVSLVADQNKYNSMLWQALGDHGKEWIPAEAQVNVNGGSQVKIDFKAIAGYGPNGVFGLDDITLRHGKCSSQGSCNFHNFDSCGWRKSDGVGVGSLWRIYASDRSDFGIDFQPRKITQNITSSWISEQFEGYQVQCIHFQFSHLAGDGNLYLTKVPVFYEQDKQLLWKMDLTNGNSFQRKPARVSVDSTDRYEIHLSAEAYSDSYHVQVNNILVTNQPCLAEPAEAVSFDCDFSDGTCFWYQDLLDDNDWVVTEGVNASHTAKVEIKSKGAPFAYLEPAFNKAKAVSKLWSPVIPAGERCLKFSSLKYGADFVYLKLLMKNGYKHIAYIDWRRGDALKEWKETTIDLTSDDNYQLVFEGMCKDGNGCSIAITNIEISSSSCPDTWHSGKYNRNDAGRNGDDGGGDTDDDGGNDIDDNSGNLTDDDNGGDDSGPPLGSISEPGLQERMTLQVQGLRVAEVCGPPRLMYDLSLETTHKGLYKDTADVDSQHRDHTHTGLYQDTAAVCSQPHSIAVDKQHGLLSSSVDRGSLSQTVVGQVVTDCQDSSHIECKKQDSSWQGD
ncbi:MAM and LDL-receptor class A domain-containing protein 1 [Elysia marginata]|uniref:MAM and LDL-receptor class A domain-containing protein 1 n=1 Tax=Elysia marginata TaxID=1093978 RepID=A0AAV4H2R5_9GAST|nr:MAM and LDL-receptor class A domain-containing protein 1 [Elysia marginata]